MRDPDFDKLLSAPLCMTSDLSFESAAYFEGETGKYSFDAEVVSVLAFFPGAFTGVCTEEMCSLQDQLEEFNDLDTEVIGVSVDTPFVLEEFAEQNNLEFPLVSDTEKEISDSYGVTTEMPGLEYRVANRAVFLIKNGEIIYKEVMDDPTNLPDLEKLKQEIRYHT